MSVTPKPASLTAAAIANIKTQSRRASFHAMLAAEARFTIATIAANKLKRQKNKAKYQVKK